jgi:hypothetical protein
LQSIFVVSVSQQVKAPQPNEMIVSPLKTHIAYGGCMAPAVPTAKVATLAIF